MSESFVPSVIIALSTSAAFAAGRVVAWAGRRSARATALLRIAVVALSLLAAGYFLVSRSSRYALLLPAAFTAGCLTFERGRVAPQVFPDR